jgi:hypothetical protein
VSAVYVGGLLWLVLHAGLDAEQIYDHVHDFVGDHVGI